MRSSALLSSVLAVLLASACLTPSVPHPVIAGCHPACPGAGQAAVGDAGAILRGAEAQPTPVLASELASEPMLESQAALAPSAAAYLCPMHLHIGSDAPGRCPECGMQLVPRVQALGHDHEN